MNADIRARSYWLMSYGIPRATLKVLARRGDPFARLVINSDQPERAYCLVEQIRQRGRMSLVAGNTWVTADAQLVRDVFRDGRFRTIKPRDRSPLRVVQRILAQTNPGVLNPVEPPSLLVVDPPEHPRLRRPVSRAFTPRAIEGLRRNIHDIANNLLDDLGDNSDCDLVADYAARIPIEILADMLGIPRDETPYLRAITDRAAKLLTAPMPSWRDFQTALAALRESEDYLATHIERLRASEAGNSILSTILEDRDLTDTEGTMVAELLLGAGSITTSYAFGNAVVALVSHPDQLARLQAHPDGWPNAVEEVLRYDSVSQMGARVATETIQIGRHTVREGSTIFLLIGGANRDPSLFERPDEFDTTRANARDHIGFGTGIHVCLGAALARMELHIGLQTLFNRFPELALAGEPTLDNSTLMHGIKHLPINLGRPKTVETG